MKWIFVFLALLIFHKEVHGHSFAKKPTRDILRGYVYANPPYQSCPIADLNYDFILSSDEKNQSKIKQYAMNFNFNAYNIHMVPNLGLFFLEADGKRDWIKDTLRSGEPWEGYIAPYIQTYVKPGTVALDVGAHIGTHTLTLSRAVGERGKVIAFEPRIKTYLELLMNTQVNGAKNIYCFWGALGDKNEEIHLSACHPEVEVAYLFDFTYGDLGYTAPMVTLDNLNLDNISFMKVDVDGCDDIFLDGAKETILRNRPVLLMEILGGADLNTATPEQRETILKTRQKIIDLGYRVEKISAHDYLAIPL